jgi:BON domain
VCGHPWSGNSLIYRRARPAPNGLEPAGFRSPGLRTELSFVAAGRVLFLTTVLGAASAWAVANAAGKQTERLEEVVIQVTTHNGVVRLEGIVGDTGEMFRIVRLCRKMPGARRVVNVLEIMRNDPDGG